MLTFSSSDEGVEFFDIFVGSLFVFFLFLKGFLIDGEALIDNLPEVS